MLNDTSLRESASRLPSYRRHKPSGQAVVTLTGRDIYLGPYGTKASRVEYDRLIGEWLAAGRCLPEVGPDLSIAELALRYWRFARSYYVKDGQPTGSLDRIRVALKVLRESYAHTLAKDFGPLALQAVQHRLADSGKSRRYVNYLVGGIQRVFRWAVSQQLLPETVSRALASVPGLRRGHTSARERGPVKPVPDAVTEATLPFLPAVVASMVRFQRLTGCRPGEVCSIRPCDVDTIAEVWTYRPESHKTEYRGNHRMIFIGPQAQDVLRPYLLREKTAFCFVPAESEKKRHAELHACRRTPMSCGNVPGSNHKRRPKRRPGCRYTPRTYWRTIRYAAEKANKRRKKQGQSNLLPYWSPNQLRHAAATEIRRAYGLEAAQTVLGHAKADITRVYAERDAALAAEVMRKIG